MEKIYSFKKWQAAVFLSFYTALMVAQSTASGVVTSKGSPDGLPGVSILEKGSLNGVVTDEKGYFSFDVSTGAVLLVSYVGMSSLELPAATNLKIVLESDAAALTEQVVTATRQPIRKIETTMAIEVVSAKQLREIRPEGIAEAIRNVPGIFITNAQGRYRGGVFTRGFPDGSGNGLVYTSILLDGLPTLASPARPPDFNFGMDLGVDRVEVVRGGAATLFGRAAAAGVVNVISKKGGTKHAGDLVITRYNENVKSRAGQDVRIDFNVNGPITKKLSYNTSGFYLNDRGYRNLGYGDRGFQFRTNFDYLIGKNSNVRVYGSYADLTIMNMIDIPYNLRDMKPKSDWTIYDSYYTPEMDTIAYRVQHIKELGTVGPGNIDTITRNVKDANKDGNYARGYMSGVRADLDLGNGFTLTEHFRFQQFKEGTKFNLGSSTFYSPLSPVAQTSAYQFRILVDGDAKEKSIFNEIRLAKEFKMGEQSHRFTLGHYFSRQDYRPETYSWLFWSSANRDSMRHGTVAFSPTLFRLTPQPLATASRRFGSRSRIEQYYEDVNAVFLGYEGKIGALNVTGGLRYDALSLKLTGYNRADTILRRDTTHADYSASLGLNYLLFKRTAVYANFTRAFRMPDYSAYTALAWTPATQRWTNAPDGIKKNEIVQNAELGIRSGLGDLSLDAALFYTKISNRLAVFYENGVAVSRPQGTNSIRGLEVGLTYAPSQVRGLLIRGNMTYQRSIYDDFNIQVGSARAGTGFVYNVDPNKDLFGNKIVKVADEVPGRSAAVYFIDLKGKQLPSVPGVIFNLIGSYDWKYFGVNANYNLLSNGYFDATNLVKMPDFHTINAGAYARWKIMKSQEIRLDFMVKNLVNSDDAFRILYISDTDTVLKEKQRNATLDSSASGWVSGIPQLPRRFLLTLSYKF
jgi:iron complex outermembrane recepter protein